MATKGRETGEVPPCTVCGGELNASGECTICGTKHDANGRPLSSVRELTPAAAIEQLTQVSGVGESKARALYERGYTSLEALQAAPIEDVARVPGIGDKLAKARHFVWIVGVDFDCRDIAGAVEIGLRLWQRHKDDRGIVFRHSDLKHGSNFVGLDPWRRAHRRHRATWCDERERVTGAQR